MPYKDKEKQQRFNREWMARRRAKFIAVFGGKCCKCGSTAELQFDHRDPKKKVSHRIWSWREDRIAAELKKCQLLCLKCHAQKTELDKFGLPQHGTRRMYRQKNCRCTVCRDYNASRTRWYRSLSTKECS